MGCVFRICDKLSTVAAQRGTLQDAERLSEKSGSAIYQLLDFRLLGRVYNKDISINEDFSNTRRGSVHAERTVHAATSWWYVCINRQRGEVRDEYGRL